MYSLKVAYPMFYLRFFSNVVINFVCVYVYNMSVLLKLIALRSRFISPDKKQLCTGPKIKKLTEMGETNASFRFVDI